jgi:hypothetical protein
MATEEGSCTALPILTQIELQGRLVRSEAGRRQLELWIARQKIWQEEGEPVFGNPTPVDLDALYRSVSHSLSQAAQGQLFSWR